MNIQNSSGRPDQARSGQSALTAGYMSGFGNGSETEALPGALPIGRNSPQKWVLSEYRTLGPSK